MQRSSSLLVRILFAALALAMIAWAGDTLVRQWIAFQSSGAKLSIRWGLLGASGAFVLAAYAVLIETWRRTVRAWDSELGWWAAARIWMVSNLGRYVPGKVWQIGAMGMLAQQAGVSPVAASGSAIAINVVNLLAGFGVVTVTGASVLGNPWLTALFVCVLGAGLVALPWLVPLVTRAVGRVLRRPLNVAPLPARALWLAAIGCLIAWVLYGIAFQLLVAAVIGEAPGATASYIAAFTGSYLLGYIAIFAPGGVGVREQTLVASLGRLALAQGGAAGVIALASRLWLTVLEVVPGTVFLARHALRRRRSSTPDHVTNG